MKSAIVKTSFIIYLHVFRAHSTMQVIRLIIRAIIPTSANFISLYLKLIIVNVAQPATPVINILNNIFNILFSSLKKVAFLLP